MFLFFFRRLFDNPWLCDCRIEWIKQLILTNNISLSNVRCHRPAHLQFKVIEDIDQKVFLLYEIF